MRFFELLDHLDYRFVYILVALAIMAPVFLQTTQPQKPTAPAQRLYDTIEKMDPKDNKIVILGCEWSPELGAECRPQAKAVMRHLFQKKIKFAVCSPSPESGQLSDTLVDQVAKEYGALRNIDYTVWGYRPNYGEFTLAMLRNIPDTVVHNKEGTPISKIPMMAGLQDYHDIAAMIAFTGLSSFDGWTAVGYGRFHVPNALGCTGIIGPDAFPYYDTGQFFGLLTGLKGAAEYETLLKTSGEGRIGMQAQSFVHLLIIALIVLGNIGYFLSRLRSRRDHDAATA